MNNLRLDAGTQVLVVGRPTDRTLRQIRIMRDYGTNIVACISTDQEDAKIEGVRFFLSAAEAIAATGARVAVTFVPPDVTGHAVLEAAEAGIGLIISPTFLVPIHDTMRVRRRIRDLGAVWIGPGCAGLAIPANAINIGMVPNELLRPGNIGVIAKHSTLSLEVGFAMAQRNLGQSMWVGVGIDLMKGQRPADFVPFFAQDEETDALLMIGGLGGTDEEEFARAIRHYGFKKPVLALLSGENAAEPNSLFMRVLETRLSSSFAKKRTALEEAGVAVYDRIDDLIGALPNSQ